MNKKILNWGKMRKIKFQGPNLCILCKWSDEKSSHLFSSFPYIGNKWTTASWVLTQDRTFMNHEATLEHRAQMWWWNTAVFCFDAFRVLFVYSIWEARNRAIFQNIWFPPEITLALLMQKVQVHKTSPKPKKQHTIVNSNINTSYPWAFFNGASQGNLLFWGPGESYMWQKL